MFRDIASILLLFFLSGCDDRSAAPLRVGLTLWPGYEPLYLASSLGYLDSAQVTLVDTTSPQGSIQGLRNGDLDAAALTLDEVLLLVDQDVPLQVVLLFDYSNGGDAILADNAITGVAGLKGRRVGLESSALGTYLLSRALEGQGMSLDAVERRYIKVGDQQQAMASGEVDAVVTFDPVRSQLLAEGAREIFTSREIPREIIDVLAVHRDALQQHPERVRHLVAAWYRALGYLEVQPQTAYETMGRRLKQDKAGVEQSFSGIELLDHTDNQRLLGRGAFEPSPVSASATGLAYIMVGQQMLHDLPDIDALFSAEYLQ